ncbi:hypothetical protein, partial [Desulfovibrio sp.]|uniref:hypothetical protein n=1 Tax=Desulfovibrio sp. TaxID=885 RepID=UPI003D1066F7
SVLYEREETYAPLFAPRQSLSCDPAKFVSPACRFKVSAVARKENLPQGGGWCQPNSSFFISLLRCGWGCISVYRPQARLFRNVAKIPLTSLRQDFQNAHAGAVHLFLTRQFMLRPMPRPMLLRNPQRNP